MRFENVKQIALYYKEIPEMLHLLRQERKDLEEEYNCLRGTENDGMPRGSSPGKPTESLGLLAAEAGIGKRLNEIKGQERLLLDDEARIRGCLDALNGRYKQVILLRYVCGYSWAKTGMKIHAPDSTARNWHDKAMERFGEVLEELPGARELAARASRART